MAGAAVPQRLLRVCAAAADARSLRLQLLDELRRTVGFDHHAWLLTDPRTAVGTAPLAAVPDLPQLPRLIRAKYLTPVNRWTALDGPVALLSAATGGEPDRSLVWREVQRHHGVTDVASLVLRDAHGCWGFLDLWRTGGTFTARDAALLAAIAPPVTAALRRCQAATFVDRVPDGPRGPVVLLLSPTLDVRAQTPDTQDYLRVLVPPDEGRSPVPANAYNVAAQLLAVEAGVDAHAPTARVHLAGGRWLTLRAARIGDRPDGSGGSGDPSNGEGRDIAVTIEDSSPAERADLFARAHGLSPRESELLAHLVAGGDTRDIARAMFLSEHTVNDHLKSIFTKAAVRGRRRLLARALGT